MSEYSEKLKDPRWQKKRLKILERDNFICQDCRDKKKTLHIHHKLYFKDKEPWDIPDEYLITLCEECHENEKIDMKNNCVELILTIKEFGFMAGDIWELIEGFRGLNYHTKFNHRIPYYINHLLANKEKFNSLAELCEKEEREALNG